MTKLPMYASGLNFKCTGCGKCCTGSPGYVWLNHQEMQKIADHLGMELKAFQRKYTRTKNGKYSLIEKKPSYDCVFLNGKECSIYEERPTQCKTFPWWPENLRSEEVWQNLATACEGINDEAPLVSNEKIAGELKIHSKYMKNL